MINISPQKPTATKPKKRRISSSKITVAIVFLLLLLVGALVVESKEARHEELRTELDIAQEQYRNSPQGLIGQIEDNVEVILQRREENKVLCEKLGGDVPFDLLSICGTPNES